MGRTNIVGLRLRRGFLRANRIIGVIGMVVVIATISALAAAGANEAFPGRNGKLAFSEGSVFSLIGADGQGLAPVVTRISSTTFAFAPGSKRIAHMCLERQRSRVLSVCVSNLNGSKRKVLTHPKGLGTIEEEPAWSHDGRWIAFTHTVNADRANSQSFIYIVNVNGTGLHRVREQPACASGTGSLRDADSPDWGPKGRLVFECPAGLYVAESPFALAHPLGCSSACSPGFRSCRGLEPSFSPDGARIAISNVGIQTITATPTVTDGVLDCDEHPVSVDFSGHQPAWSPDGRFIAFIQQDTNGRNRFLFVGIADGSGNPTRIYRARGEIDSAALDWQCLGTCNSP